MSDVTEPVVDYRQKAADAAYSAAMLFQAGKLVDARKQLLKAVYASDLLRRKTPATQPARKWRR